MTDQETLVLEVKAIQRSSQEAKQIWWDYCDNRLSGVRDPNRHDAHVLREFLASYSGGALPKPMGQRPQATAGWGVVGGKGGWGGPVGVNAPYGAPPMAIGMAVGRGVVGHGFGHMAGHPGHLGHVGHPGHVGHHAHGHMGPGNNPGHVPHMGNPGHSVHPGRPGHVGHMHHSVHHSQSGGQNGSLCEFIKSGQRRSEAWKCAWQQYCTSFGDGKFDPARVEPGFIQGFVDYLAGLALADLEQASSKRGPDFNAAPPAKRQAFVGGVDSDEEIVGLVEKIKALQRSGEEARNAWWNYCDANLNGVRDPGRHTPETLQTFLANCGM